MDFRFSKLVLLFVVLLHITSCQSPQPVSRVEYFYPYRIIQRAKQRERDIRIDREAFHAMLLYIGDFIADNPPQTWREYDMLIKNYVRQSRRMYVSDSYKLPVGSDEAALFTVIMFDYKRYCQVADILPYDIRRGFVFICEQITGKKIHKFNRRI